MNPSDFSVVRNFDVLEVDASIPDGIRYGGVITRTRCIQGHSKRSYDRDARATTLRGYKVKASDPPFSFHPTTWTGMVNITTGDRTGIIAGADGSSDRAYVYLNSVSGARG